jgi:hypothetical protein
VNWSEKFLIICSANCSHMPELWFKYGTTDIVLNIKYENLLKHVTASNFALLSEEEIKKRLSDVVLTEDTFIFALSDTKSVATVVTMLVHMARAKGIENMPVAVMPKIHHVLKNNLADKTILINQIDYQSFHTKIKHLPHVVFISQITYDPLFGYGGTPTILLRNYIHSHMLEAFNARQDNLPKPAVRGPPLDVVFSYVEDIPAKSIQIIANSFGIAGICCGDMVESFEEAITQLNSISVVDTELTKSAVINTSSEIGSHLTLMDSLNSLWNAIHIVRENGSAILLSENSAGLGGRALQMFVEGRLNIEDYSHKQSEYVEGLEHLIYIEELLQKYELGIVSTLPQYYLKTKLGIKTYGSVKNMIEELLSKYGKNHKVLVVSDPDVLILRANRNLA